MSESTSRALLERRTADFDLSERQFDQLLGLAEWSIDLDISGTALTELELAIDRHIADSLCGLRSEPIRRATTLVDIGAGVGFPGLVLAVMLPDCEVTLLDSVRKKMESAEVIARELGIPNVECVWSRVEEFAIEGSSARSSFDVVTARALAPLAVLVEYAAPLLKPGGQLVAWKGSPDSEEVVSADRAAAIVGTEQRPTIDVHPYPGSKGHSLYVFEKTSETPARFPRRPGVALKKPLA